MAQSNPISSLRVKNSDALHTNSMTELNDTIYLSTAPVVENLLYAGTYLFVGAPDAACLSCEQVAEDCFDMIAGTTGLLGAADGAFILQKVKRMDNKALLDIAGRDQQDQRLHLNFNRECCLWELDRTETELWKEPMDPLLALVAEVVTTDAPGWSGTASQLAALLVDGKLPPNLVTRRLNIGAAALECEHGVIYESSRGHAGRQVKLRLITKRA